MSFFDDLFKDFGVGENNEIFIVTYIENKGISLIGKLKILSFDESEIYIKANKKIIKISGENLEMKTASKGEVLVFGKLKNIDLGS